jgi:O6-methylguanine-DNA--protein-cysteine methyltransferase
VIGSSGALTGFAGGLATKEQLLRLEGAVAGSIRTAA